MELAAGGREVPSEYLARSACEFGHGRIKYLARSACEFDHGRISGSADGSAEFHHESATPCLRNPTILQMELAAGGREVPSEYLARSACEFDHGRISGSADGSAEFHHESATPCLRNPTILQMELAAARPRGTGGRR